jgi:transposase-like protein
MAKRKASKRRTYSADQRTQALALYTELGPTEASRQTKIPARTISTWAKRAGLKTKVVATTAAATDAAKAKAALTREELRGELIEKTLQILRRMDAEHIDFKVVGQGEGVGAIEKVTYPLPTPSGVREYAVTVGILLDKYRLEMGESTDRRQLEHTGSVALQGVPDDELRAGLSRVLAKLEQQG